MLLGIAEAVIRAAAKIDKELKELEAASNKAQSVFLEATSPIVTEKGPQKAKHEEFKRKSESDKPPQTSVLPQETKLSPISKESTVQGICKEATLPVGTKKKPNKVKLKKVKPKFERGVLDPKCYRIKQDFSEPPETPVLDLDKDPSFAMLKSQVDFHKKNSPQNSPQSSPQSNSPGLSPRPQ